MLLVTTVYYKINIQQDIIAYKQTIYNICARVLMHTLYIQYLCIQSLHAIKSNTLLEQKKKKKPGTPWCNHS